MIYEQMKFDDFDQYDIALVHIRADGTAEVRINKLGSTGYTYSHPNVEKALADANLKLADKTNSLDKVCVSLEDGAVWDNRHGTLSYPKKAELISKPFI